MSMEIQDLVTTILSKRTEVSADRSMLVAVSGIDGSGKGYITNKLVAELNLQGIHTIAINTDSWLALPEQRFNPENPGEHFYHHAFVFDTTPSTFRLRNFTLQWITQKQPLTVPISTMTKRFE